jgi:hypothetical protein
VILLTFLVSFCLCAYLLCLFMCVCLCCFLLAVVCLLFVVVAVVAGGGDVCLVFALCDLLVVP